MMFDLYEMTMANGYFEDKERDRDDYVSFDVFYRNNPDGGEFAIFAGLEQVLDYLENLHFSTEDISYLRSLHVFSEPFLQWLETYQFQGSVYAMPEGSIIYPDEPLLTVYAPLIDAQPVETAILCEINHQSLIATKAQRIVKAAQGSGGCGGHGAAGFPPEGVEVEAILALGHPARELRPRTLEEARPERIHWGKY